MDIPNVDRAIPGPRRELKSWRSSAFIYEAKLSAVVVSKLRSQENSVATFVVESPAVVSRSLCARLRDIGKAHAGGPNKPRSSGKP